MAQAQLEHVNVTVSDLDATAAWMNRVFGWNIRWHGDAISGGATYHVGTVDQYVAIYRPPDALKDADNTYTRAGGLNHIAVVVDDLDAIESLVAAEGFTPKSHADYEPGRRFYFDADDGIEFEVVQYD